MIRFEKKDERNKKFIQKQGYDIWGRNVDKARVAEHDRRRSVKAEPYSNVRANWKEK